MKSVKIKSSMIAMLIMLLLMGSFGKAYSATCTALASGNWTQPSVWSCGQVPTCNDVIVIPASYTITISTDVILTDAGCSNTTINVNGILFFSGNSARLNLVSTATINVAQGGGIITNISNNSQKIVLGSGAAEWSSGSGNLSGPWRITDGTSQSVLPVELISFHARPGAEGIVLDWVTASEHNNRYFELERSDDGIHFIPLTRITSQAPQGNSLLKLEYSVTDAEPINGINYYRLKQVDLNFDAVYHPLIYTQFLPDEPVLFKVYPNPNNGRFFINARGIENNHEVKIVIYNKAGKMIQAYVTQTQFILSREFFIDLGESQERGLYSVIIAMEGLSYSTTLAIE